MCDVYRSQSRFVIVIVNQSRSIRLILYSFRIQIGSGAGAKLPPPRCKKSNIFGWGVFSCKRSSIEEFSTRATSWPVFSVQNPMLKVFYSIPLKRNGLSSKKMLSLVSHYLQFSSCFHKLYKFCKDSDGFVKIRHFFTRMPVMFRRTSEKTRRMRTCFTYFLSFIPRYLSDNTRYFLMEADFSLEEIECECFRRVLKISSYLI